MTVNLQGIAEWRLLEKIGEGEHTEIYRAIPEEGGDESRPVAVKILRDCLLSDEDEVNVFQIRHRIARRLSDEAAGAPFVPVHNVGSADDKPYAVMELFDGLPLTELGSKSKKGRVSAHAAVFIIKRTLRALSAAAALKEPVAHGRLEARRILIDGAGEPRLMGFGRNAENQSDLLDLSRLADNLTARWPPEVDSWIDRLKSTESPLLSPNEALAAFPHDVFPDDVDVRGRRALSRALKRARQSVDEPSAPEPEKMAAKPKKKRAKKKSAPLLPDSADGGGVDESIRQARMVMWLCAGVVMLAMAIELISHGG